MKAKKSIFRKLWNFKAAVLAFWFAFIFVFFFGIFWTGVKYENYDKTHHFYMNRGSFGTWAGEGSRASRVELPYVKAPFIIAHDVFGDSGIIKVVDLRVFLPLFLIMWIVSYPIAFPFGKAVEEHHKFNNFYYPFLVVIFLIGMYVYFLWFPRI